MIDAHCAIDRAYKRHSFKLCGKEGDENMGGFICAGINCGVLLIRNTEWAREFFADVGQYAFMHPDTVEKHMRPVRNHDPPPVCNY